MISKNYRKSHYCKLLLWPSYMFTMTYHPTSCFSVNSFSSLQLKVFQKFDQLSHSFITNRELLSSYTHQLLIIISYHKNWVICKCANSALKCQISSCSLLQILFDGCLLHCRKLLYNESTDILVARSASAQCQMFYWSSIFFLGGTQGWMPYSRTSGKTLQTLRLCKI